MTTSKQAVIVTSLWLLMIALLSACNPIQAPLITVTPEPTIAFPVQRPVEGERVFMQAAAAGKLVLDNGCLRIKDAYALVWPPGFTLDTEEETVRVRDEAGQVVARIGDEVSMDGGTSITDFSFVMDEPPPAVCTPPHWVIGQWGRTMTTYNFTNGSAYLIRRPPEIFHRVPNDEILSARLVLTEGCFQVREPATGTDYVPLWPPDFTMQEEGEEIYIIDGKGKRVAQADEIVQLKGGKEEYSTITSELLAGRCTEPFWEVSTVIEP